MDSTAQKAAMCTLLSTDLVESTQLISRIGDRRTSEFSARMDRTARDLLRRHRGLELERTDGFLIRFDETADAIRFVLDLQRTIAAIGSEFRLTLAMRAGIHREAIILRENSEDDIAAGAKRWQADGIAIPLVARLGALAGGQQILLSKAAFDDAREHGVRLDDSGVELAWHAHGPYLVKGLEDPVEVFEVGIEGVAPLRPPEDVEKARRSVKPEEEQTLGWRPAAGLSIPGRPGWRLLKKLGEGGFGEVWLGERDKAGAQRVFKFCFRADRLRALKREVALFRVIQGTLAGRKNIARIVDWSFENPPFFIESEYAKEGTLADWVAARGGIDAIPLEVRIRLVAETAEAAAAAHSAAVLHKDIKPSNILIELRPNGDPTAILADFGIGLLTDRASLAANAVTDTGLSLSTVLMNDSSRSGTRLYAAPELIEGAPASIRTDLYALGVLLYQMAGGGLGRALATGWESQIEDSLLRDDIRDCVNFRPDARMHSAGQLAERLRTLPERRQAQRRQRMLRGAGFGSLALLLAVGALGLAWNLELTLRESAERARDREVAARTAAEAARDRERAALESERIARTQAEDLSYSMLYEVYPKLRAAESVSALETVVKKSLEYVQTYPSATETSETLRRRGKALDNIANWYSIRREYEPAITAAREAITTRQRMVSLFPEIDSFRDELAVAWNALGLALAGANRMSEALEAFEQDLRISRTLHREDPENWRYAFGLVMTLKSFADHRRRMGEILGAEVLAREAVNLSREWEKKSAGGFQHDRWRTVLADSRRTLANMLFVLRRYSESIALYREVVQGLRPPGSSGEARASDLFLAHFQLGVVLLEVGQFAEAKESLGTALASARSYWTGDYSDGDAVQMLKLALWRSAQLAREEKDYATSRQLLEEALEISEKHVRATRGSEASVNELALAERELAHLHRDLGETTSATIYLNRCLPTLARAAEPANRDASLQQAYMIALLLAGKSKEAEPLVRLSFLRGDWSRTLVKLASEAGLEVPLEAKEEWAEK